MAHTIFLTAFYTVAATIVVTVAVALFRSWRDVRRGEAGRIRWHSDFHDLPAADRVCRHVLTGEFASRQCPNAFDCRECATHAAWIKDHPPAPAAESDDELFGLSFPLNRFYHRGHAWARPESDGTVTIGVDDLGSRLLGAPDAVELPEPGTRLAVSQPAFRIRKREAEVRVLSPVDGEVVEAGGVDRGYFLRVKPIGDSCDLRHLLRGVEVRPWLTRELERLQLVLSPDGATPALADGGVPVADISAQYPSANWDAVCGEMFLEP